LVNSSKDDEHKDDKKDDDHNDSNRRDTCVKECNDRRPFISDWAAWDAKCNDCCVTQDSDDKCKNDEENARKEEERINKCWNLCEDRRPFVSDWKKWDDKCNDCCKTVESEKSCEQEYNGLVNSSKDDEHKDDKKDDEHNDDKKDDDHKDDKKDDEHNDDEHDQGFESTQC